MFSAPYFVQKQQVSLRTVQGDIKAIKSELTQCPKILYLLLNQHRSVSYYDVEYSIFIVALQRMENYFFIDVDDFETKLETDFELEMARDIMNQLSLVFNRRIPGPARLPQRQAGYGRP